MPAFVRLGSFWLRTFILATTLLHNISWAAESATPSWAEPLARFEAAIYSGHAERAVRDVAKLEASLTSSPALEQLRVVRRIFDLCWLAWQTPCVHEAFRRFTELHQQIQAGAGLKPDALRLLASDAIERVTRILVVTQDHERLREALPVLERSGAVAFDSFDFVQTNLTLADGYAQLGDLRTAARYLRRGWLFFLCDRGMTAEQFVTYLPHFIALFRRTGQLERAQAALLIADGAIGSFADQHLYAGIPLLQARIGIHTDSGNLSAALYQVRIAQTLLARLELPDWLARHYRIALDVEHTLLCGLYDSRKCDQATLADLRQLFDERDSKNAPLTPEQRRSAAVALALHSTATATALHAEVRDELEALERTRPQRPTTPTEGDVELAAGRVFVAVLEQSPDRRERAIAAAELEVSRTAKRIAENPFEAIVLPTYSRVVLMMGAAALVRDEVQTEERQSLLITISDLLKQSPRSVESRYMHLLSSMPNRERATSLQALHRLEQRLFALEKEKLQGLVDLTRSSASQNLQFDTDAWLRFDELVRAIAGHDKTMALARQTSSQIASQLSELRAALGPDEVYVSPLNVLGSVVRICIDRQRFSAQIEQYDPAKFALATKLVGFALSNPTSGDSANGSFPVGEARYLSSMLLGSGEKCLGEHRDVVFALDAATISTPMAALLDPASPQADDDASTLRLPWLGLKRNISIVNDTSQLLSSRRLRGPSRYPRAFLGVGDPSLSGLDTLASRGTPRLLRGVKKDGVHLEQLDELPDTADELRALAAAFGDSARVMLRHDATELAVRRLVLDDYRVVSFATHGLVREEITGVSEPALVLTPSDPLSPLDDGLLTASEIAQLDLRAQVVLLSACNSANFDLQLFGPQAASLSSSFFLAGARSTVASLWSVDSEATGILFKEFASRFAQQGLSVSEAMREAALALVESNPKYRHPKYWAAFVVFGDGLYQDHGARGAASRLEEIALSKGGAVPGELSQILATGPDEVLVSGIVASTTTKARSQLHLLHGQEVVWTLSDRSRSFLIPQSRRLQGFPTIVSWRYSDATGTDVTLRQYSRSGELLSEHTADFPASHRLYAAAALPEQRILLVGVTNRDPSRQEARLVLVSADGRAVTTLRLAMPPAARFRGVSVFPADRGVWVAVAEEVSIQNWKFDISPLGARWPCDTRVQTQLTLFDANLEATPVSHMLQDMTVASIASDGSGHGAAAVTVYHSCRHYDTTASGIALLRPGTPVMLRRVGVAGFSDDGRLVFPQADGGYVLISTIRRNLAESGPLSTDWATTAELFSARRLLPGRTTGVLVARFDQRGSELSRETYFNGGMTLVTSGARTSSGLWLAGSNNWTSFLSLVPSSPRPQ